MKSYFLLLLLSLSVSALETYPLNHWQKALAAEKEKNVLNYYYLLPDEFFDPEGKVSSDTTIECRDTLITVSDIANGYIQFSRTAEIALFKDRKNKKDIIAIQIWKSGAGSNVSEGNLLLEFDSQKRVWIDRRDLLPKNYKNFQAVYKKFKGIDIFPYFDLPRTGTTILIRDEENNRILDTLYWTGSSFTTK